MVELPSLGSLGYAHRFGNAGTKSYDTSVYSHLQKGSRKQKKRGEERLCNDKALKNVKAIFIFLTNNRNHSPPCAYHPPSQIPKATIHRLLVLDQLAWGGRASARLPAGTWRGATSWEREDRSRFCAPTGYGTLQRRNERPDDEFVWN